MASKTIQLHDVKCVDVANFFKLLLTSLRCIIIKEEGLEGRFHFVAVNRMRASLATLMLTGLFGGGLLLRNRIGIEAVILENGKAVSVNMAVKPYLGEFDLEDSRAGHADKERCQHILDLLIDKIKQKYV
ncbi:MAG: hypothetical protein AOA65_1429 [Candidatus Bathyarchaeota archaeon BA1]|nr:MAG: hypothetical protein AOA65_1429 [Candidatus Bathyarchaeota archaeon BA1]